MKISFFTRIPPKIHLNSEKYPKFFSIYNLSQRVIGMSISEDLFHLYIIPIPAPPLLVSPASSELLWTQKLQSFDISSLKKQNLKQVSALRLVGQVEWFAQLVSNQPSVSWVKLNGLFSSVAIGLISPIRKEKGRRMGEEIQVPRGGPIYIGNMASPLTRVPDFEAAVLRQLQDLEAELCLDSSQLGDHDLSVDELKVYTEEELVEMAFKEAFKDEENGENGSQPPGDCSNAGGNSERSERENSTTFESSIVSHSETSCKEIVIRKNSKKRKRKKENRLTMDSYIGKVEQLAIVKQKQDEDKAAARLHSFNSSFKINECVVPSSDKIERMKSLRSTNSAKHLKSSDIQEHVPVLYPEIVLCVEVYHTIRKWVKTQEFLVLGRQTLTELRDKIYCLSDQVMQKAGEHDPSGYFLIEDIFYNDLRDPSAIDYSEPVFDWLRDSKDEALKKWECIINGELQQKQKAILGTVSTSHLPHFKAFHMHKTRFCDLRFRLGAGYLYCHQGDCKHTIVIRDMRLIHREDVQNQVAYPIVIFQLKPRAQKCSVCRIYRATKVAVDDKWAQENPCYFCDYCYSLLHSQDGAPPSENCSVYEYIHD